MKTERDLFIPFIGKLEEGSNVADFISLAYNADPFNLHIGEGDIWKTYVYVKHNFSDYVIYLNGQIKTFPDALVFESEEEMKVAEIAINHKANPFDIVNAYHIDKAIKNINL